MKFKELKQYLTQQTQQLENSYVQPKELLRALQAEHGRVLPEKLQEAFNNYQIEYNKLTYSHKKIQTRIDSETSKGTDDDVEMESIEEMEAYYPLLSSFQRMHVDLQLARNLAYRDQHQQGVFSSDQESEKIVLMSQDFSQTCVNTIKEKINDIFTATSGSSNIDQMSMKLNEIGHDSLVEGGVSNGHLTDYPRRAYVFLNTDLPELQSPTGDPIKDDLETVVQAYLTYHELDQKAAPNVRAMITTLSYQSGLQGMGNIFLKSGFMHAKLAEQEFTFETLAARSTIFFNKEIGKLQFEMFMENEILQIFPSFEVIKPANVSQKITLDIDVQKDEKGYPTFVAEDPKISFSIVRPIDFAESHPIRIVEANLQNPTKVDPQHIDSFHPFLEDMAKFAGYSSLEEIYYSEPTGEKTEQFQRFDAKRKVEVAHFDTIFIGNLKTLNSDEKAFLQKLSNDYYINGKNKVELGKEVFQFVERQLSSGKLSYSDKFRYMHLLRVAADLSGDKNRPVKIIDNLVKNELGMSELEKEFFKEKCGMIYDKETDLKKLSEVTARSVQIIQSEINKVQDSKEIDEARLTYLIKIAVYYSLPLPDSFDPAKVITILSNMSDSKSALFQGAKLHPGVYQQILEPPKGFWLFEALRTFGEWLGIVKPRPNEKIFSEQEHAELIGKHFPLSSTGVTIKNPYMFLSENSDHTFKGNLEFNTLEGKLAFLKEFAANRSSNDFDELIRFAPNFLKECDTAFSNSPNQSIFWKSSFSEYFSSLWKNGKPEIILAMMKEMPNFFAAAAKREDFLPTREKLAFLVAFPNSSFLQGQVGDAFFKGLDQKLTDIANQPVNIKNNEDMFIRRCFEELLSNADPTIVSRLPNLFSVLQTNVSSSFPQSIHSRLKMLVEGKDLKMSQDELVVFLKQLNEDLLTLAKTQFQGFLGAGDQEAISSIITIVQSDQGRSYSDKLTGFEAILTVGSNVPEQQSERLIEELAEARLRIPKSLEDASHKINLAASAQSSTSAPVPVESSGHHP